MIDSTGSSLEYCSRSLDRDDRRRRTGRRSGRRMDAGFFGTSRGAAELACPGRRLEVSDAAADVAFDVATLRQHRCQLLPPALDARLRAGRGDAEFRRDAVLRPTL